MHAVFHRFKYISPPARLKLLKAEHQITIHQISPLHWRIKLLTGIVNRLMRTLILVKTPASYRQFIFRPHGVVVSAKFRWFRQLWRQMDIGKPFSPTLWETGELILFTPLSPPLSRQWSTDGVSCGLSNLKMRDHLSRLSTYNPPVCTRTCVRACVYACMSPRPRMRCH